MLLAALDRALTIQDMNIPGFRLHQLNGRASDHWSIQVSGHWRLRFEFQNGQAQIIDYEDYH